MIAMVQQSSCLELLCHVNTALFICLGFTFKREMFSPLKIHGDTYVLIMN